MNKNDMRYIKNDKLIKQTFIRLLRHHSYDKITLNLLCNECLISKHAFYSHFENMDFLLKQVIHELLEGMVQEYKKQISNDYDMEDIQDRIYDYVKANQDVFHTLFLQDEFIHFSEAIVVYMKKYAIHNDSSSHLSMNEVLSIDYMLYGDVSILKKWVLNYNCQDLEGVKSLAATLLKNAHLQIQDITHNMTTK